MGTDPLYGALELPAKRDTESGVRRDTEEKKRSKSYILMSNSEDYVFREPFAPLDSAERVSRYRFRTSMMPAAFGRYR